MLVFGMQCSRELTCKHEPKDKPTTVSPLKRVNRSFSGTLSYDSPLRKKKKALTKSALNPSLGSGKTKKTVSHTFKTVGVSRRRELEMVKHKKRVTALKLKSVA
ncbi:hypothetical protein Bca52824_040850 [Brassica carinata]|uniref:Uncharacterized protein n=1 Tax=Brassica carinata TaxID=52824 RepID=A0A8X7UY86_BRACI|nr:hypothetical protein Bca52824_040850 [Brassica carinata]